MTQVFVNNFRAEIAQTFGESDTYLTVDSTAGFPTIAPGNFALLTVFRLLGVAELGHEVVKVTAVNANMFTVERSVEGATASQFEEGDVVEARLTAGSMAAKQVTLVSGTNIKTINGTNLLGSGDLLISTFANLDGGAPDSVYGGTPLVDGGTV